MNLPDACKKEEIRKGVQKWKLLYSSCVPIQKPGNHIAFAKSERAVMVADAHHTNAVASFFEVK